MKYDTASTEERGISQAMRIGNVKTQLNEKRRHKACVLYHFHSADLGPLEDTSTSPSLGHSGPHSYKHTDCYTEHHMCPQHKLKEIERERMHK